MLAVPRSLFSFFFLPSPIRPCRKEINNLTIDRVNREYTRIFERERKRERETLEFMILPLNTEFMIANLICYNLI